MSQLFGKYRTKCLLHAGHHYQVFLAEHIDLRKYYILKVEALDYPSQRRSAVAWEFDLLKNSDIQTTLKPIHLIEEGHQRVGVYEFRQTQALHEKLGELQFTPFVERLRLAVAILRALQAVHSKQISLGDLSPANILIVEENSQVFFIDFTRAQAPHHYAQRRLSNQLDEGNLAYISPEQTGRLRRSIDHRSDLYSAGMLIYHILSGRVPFQCETTAEYFHHHLALSPPPLSSIGLGIDEQVSLIITKLYEKDPETRYFSAWGAAYDLELCLKDLSIQGKVKSFPLGSKDVADILTFPRLAVGREREINELREAFAPFRAGQTSCILLAGNSGIGKSTLIDDLKLRFLDDSLLWITSGSQARQNPRPYEGVIRAFGGMIKRLLTLSEKELNYWRNIFRDALGENGYLVIRLIPELELIIGSQMIPAELGPLEEQSRFELTFRQFLRSFSQTDHKLVLVIDDIQWLDEPSFHIIRNLMVRDAMENFLLIGIYKTDGHDQNFDLPTIGRELSAPHINFQFMRMGGLDLNGISEFLVRTFAKDKTDIAELAVVIQEKTRGNPFFIKEFLRRAYERGDVWFQKNDFMWKWNLGRLQSDSITDNTVILVMEEIKSLSQEAIQVICTAACIGLRFRLDDLLLVMNVVEKLVKKELLSLCDKGLILPNNEVSLNLLKFGDDFISNALFSFSHPRIHEAALSILDTEAKNHVRFQLGINQLKVFSKDQVYDHIYELVEMLNSMPAPTDLKIRIAQLNLLAAKKSRRSSAFQGSMQYLKRTANLLAGEGPWLNHYELTLDLFREVALVAFLNKEFETMNFAVVEVLRNARNLLDMIAVYEVKIQESMTNNMAEAIDIAELVLKRLGVRIPREPNKLQVIYALGKIFLHIRGRDFVRMLENMPKADDPYMEAAIRIGCKVGSAAVLARPNLTPILVAIGLHNGMKYGHVTSSAFAYAAFGAILTGLFQRFDDAHRLGQFSIQLAKSFREKDQLCRVEHMIHAFIRPWKESLHLCLPGLLKAYRLGLESGEFEYACHAINIYSFYSFYAGTNLAHLDEELLNYRQSMDELNQKHLNVHIELYRQGILNLRIGSQYTYQMEGDSFSERHNLRQLAKAKDLAFYHAALKLILAYYFHADKEALDFSKICREHADAVLGSYAVPSYLFFEALARLRLLQKSKLKWKWREEKRILKTIKRFRKWSLLNEPNFKHRLRLLQAEWWRYRQLMEKSLIAYRQSLELAKQYEFVNDQALIAERYASYLGEKSLFDLESYYRHHAIELYEQWGASKKVHLLQAESQQSVGVYRNLDQTLGKDQLDVEVMVTALREIADETNHDSLEERILSTAMSFAGADRAHLIRRDPAGETLGLAKTSADELRGNLGLPVSEIEDVCHAVINLVTRTLKPLVIDDAQLPNGRIPGLENDPYIAKSLVRSLACIPLTIRDDDGLKLVGLIYLENTQAAYVFSRDRFQILDVISQTAAARFDLSVKANTLEASLKEAQLVQQALLPSKLGTEYFKVSDYYRAADHAGGDWFGFYEDKKRGRLYFLLGDVTGHGVSSSLVTGTAAGSAYSSFATMEYSSVDLSLEDSIQVIAAAVNRAVCDTAAKVAKMMTMVFVAIESYTGRGVYISAGHPAGCIIGRTKNHLLKPAGSPLGYRGDPSYQVEGFHLKPGESLFFYTDGLFENRGPDGRELKLRHVLKQLKPENGPERNRDLILQMGRAIWREQHPEDDCAFVLIQWRGQQSSLEVDVDKAS
ncbi:MAG: SpoIIE family protein phosphatase [Oligoflexus sp.]